MRRISHQEARVDCVAAALLLIVAVYVPQAEAHPDEIVETLQRSLTRNEPPPKNVLIGRPMWEIDAKVPFIGSPVHERMTADALTLSNVHARSYDVDYDDAYIHGVFWNDDPEDLLCPSCSRANPLEFNRRWGLSFADRMLSARKKASKGDGKTPVFRGQDGMLERSHYGDLQFLHSMASADAEPASRTQRNILIWAEFVYRVAIGDIDQRLPVSQVPVSGIPELFADNRRYSSMLVENLFRGRKSARRVAIGTLLHMIQDSYAPGHAEREILSPTAGHGPPRFARGSIREFHSYANQDPEKHKRDDAWPPGLGAPYAAVDDEPVSVSARILGYMYADDGRGAPWEDVRQYLTDVVFRIAEGARPAGPGDEYLRVATKAAKVGSP